jgi:hypothetical protein
VAGSGGSSENWELNIVVPVLNASWSSDLLLFIENCGSDDRNGIRRGTMVSCHFGVQLTNGSIERDISVLLIHVVVACSGFVSQNNSEGLDVVWLSLKDLIYRQDLTLSTLGLKLTSEVVPEFRFGNYFVSGKKTDGKDFGVGLLLSG